MRIVVCRRFYIGYRKKTGFKRVAVMYVVKICMAMISGAFPFDRGRCS